ncbi:MAG TPA: hypothetical protein EYG50_08610 [Cycloclasticus sp.]|jgi:hypothetical protein|nr:hypothetical protein [Cycloclasticus sp.]HIL92780.1 hypothetical protein [Cycloclasticus sp.]
MEMKRQMLPMMKREKLFRLTCSVILPALFFTGPVVADDVEELVQEVFKSDLVYAQEADEIQFTFAPQYTESSEGATWALPIAIEYGITDNLQVELEWVSHTQNNPDDESANSGIGDVEIGLQYSWMNIADSSFHTALGVEISIPFGDDKKELGEGEKSLATYLILAADVSEGLHTYMQLGAEFPEHEARERFLNLGVVASIGENTAFTLEYNWDEEAEYLTPGLAWSPIEDWELGVGVPMGINNDADDFQLILHVILEIGA